MSTKVLDAKREMKEYLKTRRKTKFESCIIYKPITLTFDFKDDDNLRRGQTDKTLLAGGADIHATATNTSKVSSADVVTARQ